MRMEVIGQEEPYYKAVQKDHLRFSPNNWAIQGGGQFIVPWKRMQYDHARMMANMMNVAREVAILETNGSIVIPLSDSNM